MKLRDRSLAASILLPLFFGPIGLLYASFWWALGVLFAMIIFGSIPKLQFLPIFLWGMGPFLSVFIVMREHKKTEKTKTE